ncbi:MAG TPA: diguanylate cyclase [Thermoanaerobaculia bacterium]|nr:diguanylate cyclase [Thermoanaerobaculia bacterium]
MPRPTNRSCGCAGRHPRQGDPSPYALIADPALAALLRRSLRQGDSIGRCGGEEFAVLIGRSGEEAAHHVMERLRREFAALVRSGMSLVDWREAADAALYAAKARGRNRVELALPAIVPALRPPSSYARPEDPRPLREESR